MKKVTTAMSFALVQCLLVSCGPSGEYGTNCMEECAMTFSKNYNQCDVNHGPDSTEGMACSKLAFQTNDRCLAKCHGNL